MDFLKKVNKASGIIACAITIIANFLLLSVGTGILRVEFYYVTQALIPSLISKVFLIVWCLYFAFGYEYDKSARVFARALIPFIFISIIVLLIDIEIVYFFIFQSVTTLLVLVLMSNLINQKRFALREKKYADKLYQLDILIKFCIVMAVALVGLSIPIAIKLQPSEYNIALLICSMIAQVFVIIGIFCVETAEKKFNQSLVEGYNPTLNEGSIEEKNNEN